MRAMVLAAGLGTRLRPLTYEITKPMVPVLDRPVMEHILDLLDRHSFGPVIANLHHFPDTIREYFGDRVSYSYEPELLGTAGGVRECAQFFGSEPFLVVSGEALLLIEGEERPLKAWDFVHCPRWTEHVFVGAGKGPCAILAVGARTGGGVVYPVSEVALKHGAGVEQEVHTGAEAYAGLQPDEDAAFQEAWLP